MGPAGSAYAYNNTCIMGTAQNNYNIKWEGVSDIQNNAIANSTQFLATMANVTTKSWRRISS